MVPIFKALQRYAASIICIVACTVSVPLSARSYPPSYEAESGVNAWQELAEDDRYHIIVADPFEDTVYRPYAPSTELADIRYIYDSPLSKAFNTESFLTGQSDQSRRSLLVMTSFTIPGKQNFQFKPDQPIVIRGQPYRLAVWIRSNEYRHRIEFLFRNADSKLIRVDGGQLYWKGWQRLDITLPANLHKLGRRIGHQTGATFEGIVIYSNPKSAPGNITLQFDSLLILSDFNRLNYNGAEIVDEW